MAEQCWRNGAEPQQHSISGSLLTETLFKPSAPPFQPGQIAVNGELYSGLPIQEAYVPYPPHPADLALLSENPHSKALQHVPNPSASSSSGILYAEHSPSARNSDRNYLQYPYHMDWISHSGALGSRSQSTTSLREKMLKALQRNSEFFIPMSNNQFAERRGNPSRSPRNGAGGQEVIERYQQAGQTKIEDSIRRSGLTAGLKELALERLRRNAHTADDNLPHISRSSPLEIVAPNPRRRTHIRLIEEGNRVSDSIVRECHVQSPEGHSSLPFATRVGCANEKSNARQQSMTNSESVRHHYVMRNERTNTPPAPGYPHGPSILSPLFRPEPENSSPFPPLELESSKNNVRSLTNDEPVSATINAHHQGSMDDVRPGSVNEQGLFPMAAHPKSAYEKAKAVVGVGQFTAVSQAPDNRPNQKSGDRHASKPNLVALSQLSMPNEINSREKRLIYDRVNMTNLPKRILGFRSCMDCLYSSNWLIRPCKHLICTSCASFWFDDRNQNSGRYFCGFCFAKMNKIEPVQTTKAPRIHSIAEESLGLTSKPPPRMVPRINNSRIAYDSLLSQGFASATVHNHPFVNHPPESVDMSDQSRSPPRPALGLSSNLPTSRTSLAPLGSYPEHRSTKRVMVAAGANHGFPQAAEQLETSTTEASLITGMKTASTLDAASASRLPTLDHMPVYAPSSHTAFGPYFTSPPEISIYPSQPNTLYPTHANTMYPRAGHNWIAHSNIPDVHGFPQPHGGGWHYLAPEELTLPVSLGGTFMAPAASQNQRLPGFISPPAFHSLNYPPSTVSLANGDQGQLQNFGHLQQNVASRFPLPVAEIPIDSLQQSVGPYSRSIPSIPSQTNRGSHLEHGDVVSMGHAMDPEHASGSTASVISSQVGSTSYLSGPASTFAGGTQTHDSTSKSPHGYAKSSFTPKSVAPVPVTSAVPIGSVRNQDAPLPRLISYEQACHDAPFVELVRRTKPAEWGVIKISNVRQYIDRARFGSQLNAFRVLTRVRFHTLPPNPRYMLSLAAMPRPSLQI
ncbi:hypothetical protein L228DRAFT_182785 [Xylona heveae TC161]|uniref:RING-type domain-containing protein n=1 Tax=Xylona heveae (strain CBS 132557 / TC161) TaxID=1328760 RepID=A0A165FG66_XYLHT|nr:hypothetical protein L228DRAFT_182785 [Xylona heveae TC161]KZF20938.1 hypothetical protein L228DRAFT_182785 [Xylona heveae TC161]